MTNRHIAGQAAAPWLLFDRSTQKSVINDAWSSLIPGLCA